MYSRVSYAESVMSSGFGEITVEIEYGKETALFIKYTPIVHISLLSDTDDILAQIEDLREQSKTELEPLIKQYMLTAEKLTRLTTQTDAGQTIQQTKKQLSNNFKAIDERIHTVLVHYQKIIDSRIQQHTLKTFILPGSVINHQFKDIAPGKYRLYGVMMFATTTLRWFEPVVVKGGDRPTVYLTHDNMMNPYWTELNWWSFMNLDFSKQH